MKWIELQLKYKQDQKMIERNWYKDIFLNKEK